MYLIDLCAISPQKTTEDTFKNGEIVTYCDIKLLAIEPNYLEFIPANLLRRMGKAVRMGIGTAMPLMKKYSKLDGLIIGTANGGLEDCIKFLNQLVDYDEGVLTPTNFVQSTPNSLAGQLAIMTQNTGYNSTHVHSSFAFENALIDALLFFENQTEDSNLLVGAVEEISEYNFNIDLLQNRFKQKAISTNELLESNSPGTICGEGSAMFVMSNNAAISHGSVLAEILDVRTLVSSNFEHLIQLTRNILTAQKIEASEIDLVVLGSNGDNRFDDWYDRFANTLFPNTPIETYKNLCGDYKTASAFALFKTITLNNRDEKRTVLFYNQLDGVNHGVILLKTC